MENTTTKSRALSRRSFIRGSAAAAVAGAGTAALCSCSSAPSGKTEVEAEAAAPETEIRLGVCRSNCMNGCPLDLHVRDGILVRTTAHDVPDPQYKRICPKGLTQPARVYSPERLQYPMRRVGERGEGAFERISWDEAVDEIASKWKAFADEFGPASNTVFYQSGNMAIAGGNGFCNTTQRFVQATGFSTIGMDTDMAGFTVVSKMCGNISATLSNNEFTDFKNSKTFVCWGFNPAVSLKQAVHFITEAKEAGTRYIVIDPAFNTNAAMADWYVPINPSTDGALAMAMINEVMANGWEDRDFVRDHTESPLLIRTDNGRFLRMSDLGTPPAEGPADPMTGQPTVIDPYVVWDEAVQQAVALEEAQSPALTGVSEVGGIAVRTEWDVVAEAVAPWTPEAAEEVCGIPAADIRELARIYAQEGPVNTYTQYGCNHYHNAPYNYWPMDALCMITGNTGKPGAAFGMTAIMGTHLANFAAVFGATDSAGNPAQGAGPEYTMNSINDIIQTGKFGERDAVLKSVFIRAANPVCTFAGHSEMVEWIRNIEFVVVADMVMTETAKYADILLPAAHWFECTDLFTSHYTFPYSVYQKAPLQPLYESKPDFEILKTLAEALGYGSFFDFDEEGYMELWLDSDGARELGVTLDRLKEELLVRNLPQDYVSFEGGVFPTATGRAIFYVEDPVPGYNNGQAFDPSIERTLYWEPALEADVHSAVREKYPFHVISEHMRTRTHTQWWDVGYLQSFEPGPRVRINPDDAASLGIAEGDMVRLYNDRGSVTLQATLCPGYPRGIVGCPRSFQADEYVDGHINSLSMQTYNQGCPNAIHNDVAVAIEKA